MKEATLQAKKAVVSEIKEMFEKSQSVVLVDYRGLNVEQDTELRNKMRAAGVEYRVLKNTMAKRALADLGIEGLNDLLAGPTAIAFGYEDATAPARVISEFAKKNEQAEIKGGLLGKEAIDIKQIQYLASLPSKEELIAKMLGSMNAPITNFVGVLAAVPRAFVCALDQIRQQKEA